MRPEEVYYQEMARRGRLLRVSYGHGMGGLCSFFLLNHEGELETFHDRPAWSTPPDAPDGTLVYIDTYVGSGLTRQLVHALEETFTRLVPDFQTVTWFGTGQEWQVRHTWRRTWRRHDATALHG